MSKEQFVLAVLMSGLIFTTSCGQEKPIEEPQKAEAEESAEWAYTNIHQYGGWYCPDNFGGFPPVDIQDLHKIPVVADRLPTREETRNGTSLMYFDKTKIPEASALQMELPRLARVYNQHSGIDELAIIIQAVVAGNDTVVGYRFPNGGNGLAWYRQVTFLSDAEVDELGSMPIVFVESEIKGTRHDVWKAFTGTDYARRLGETFDQREFFSSEWSDDTRARLDVNTDEFRANGYVAVHYGNLYLQIDYDYNGFHYAEKMLLLEDAESNTLKLQLAAGPYPGEFEAQQANWENWLSEVKKGSELD